MAKATLKITGELLREAFHLPIGTIVHGSECSTDGCVDVVVEHEDIPEAKNQMVSPSFRRQPEVLFEGWGPSVK